MTLGFAAAITGGTLTVTFASGLSWSIDLASVAAKYGVNVNTLTISNDGRFLIIPGHTSILIESLLPQDLKNALNAWRVNHLREDWSKSQSSGLEPP